MQIEFCCKKKRFISPITLAKVSSIGYNTAAPEPRGGALIAALYEDNERRLSNPISMTLPLAVLLDYQPFAASVTSEGLFTMETSHPLLPTEAYYRTAAKSTGPGTAHQTLSLSR